MDSIAALQKARQELEAAYRKDIAAIDYLLSRLGPNVDSVAPKPVQERQPRNPEAPVKPGSRRYWVIKAFAAFPQQQLTAPNVYAHATRLGETFDTDRNQTIASIGNTMRAMVKEELLRVSVKGSGKRPSSYRWIGEAQPTDAGELDAAQEGLALM